MKRVRKFPPPNAFFFSDKYKKVSQLSADLTAQTDELIAEYDHALCKVKREASKYKEHVADLQGIVDAEAEKSAEASKTIAELQAEIADLKGKNVELNADRDFLSKELKKEQTWLRGARNRALRGWKATTEKCQVRVEKANKYRSEVDAQRIPFLEINQLTGILSFCERYALKGDAVSPSVIDELERRKADSEARFKALPVTELEPDDTRVTPFRDDLYPDIDQVVGFEVPAGLDMFGSNSKTISDRASF
ncbi:hypothetical protein EUTSA_v10028272mg [Eutrema salsugineum]|uniref:Uncharacterized protein n=1 Tax=Eutrema salsugineum TaxID=72664 RepID=V4LTA9_EUTSA|nr:meiosis-specific protein ASY2 [Eutrema salsugineum]XP_024014607.1 meiosis-specific protein ASY2 [Eutrema salsugineum]XP_024014608.1 meiosis-specific protein ASY2 [Eutrema salsugineum]ESQ47024.1 hypothetical protein EUTSA_v10028272mg [Eutrema salsugineum]